MQFLFWFNRIGVFFFSVSCTLNIGIFSLMLGNFSFINYSKYFLGHWVGTPFFLYIYYSYIRSFHRTSDFLNGNPLDLTFFFLPIYHFFCCISIPELLSAITYVFLVKINSVVPFSIPKYFISQIYLLHIFFIFFSFHFQVFNSFICLPPLCFTFYWLLKMIYSFHWSILYVFLEGFIHFLLKYHYNIHIVGFKVFFLSVNCVGIFTALWWQHSSLAVIDCVLITLFGVIISRFAYFWNCLDRVRVLLDVLSRRKRIFF